MPIRAALYIRVSTEDQAVKGFSIPEQRDRLTAYCKAKDYDIATVYADPGCSGKDTNRPGLQSMIANIKQYDVVVVYKLDRLSRSQKDTLYLIEDVLIKNDVAIVSLQENLDTSTPFGRAAIGILSAFAQLERETIRERCILGRTGRAKNGKWVGTARPPIGYDYDIAKQTLIVNQYEAEQVRQVFALYIAGNGLQKIAKIMRQHGYTHKYGQWQRWGGLTEMLTNSVYAGQVSFNGQFYPGNHEPIIDAATFARAQELHAGRKSDEVYKKKHSFSHLLYCAECGDRLFWNPRKSRKGGYLPKYQCKSRPKCSLPIWDADKIDAEILRLVGVIAIDKKETARHLARTKKPAIAREQLEKRVAEIDKQTAKLLELYQFDAMPIDQLNSKVRALQDEKAGIKTMLEQKKSAPVLTVAEVQEKAARLIDKWQEMILDQKIESVNSLIKKIVVSASGIEIYWSFAYEATE